MLEANPGGADGPVHLQGDGVPLARVAARVMMGSTLEELRGEGMVPVSTERPDFVAVKEAVLPWDRFPEEDSVLGPEMRATGEVMGIGSDVGVAYAKALLAAGHILPTRGRVFLSFADRDKPMGLAVAQAFTMLGFELVATQGTARYLKHHAIDAEPVDKVGRGAEGHRAAARGRRGATRHQHTPRRQGAIGRQDDPDRRPQPLHSLRHHDPGWAGGGPEPPRRAGRHPATEEPPGMAPDRLTTRLGPIELRSPLIAASGTVGSVWEWAEVADVSPYGAAVAKSVAPVEWPGRPAPAWPRPGPGCSTGSGSRTRASRPGWRP